MLEENAGKTPRKPIMTPGRPTTRGVTRMEQGSKRKSHHAQANSQEDHSSSKNSAVAAKSNAPGNISVSSSTSSVKFADEFVKKLGNENEKDHNLVLLMSEDGDGTLVKGRVTETALLGRVLVVDQQVWDRQVGLIMAKGQKGGEKGKS